MHYCTISLRAAVHSQSSILSHDYGTQAFRFSIAVYLMGGPNISAGLLGPARMKNMFPQWSKYFGGGGGGPIITEKWTPSPNIS